MKINELNGDQLAEALCLIAQPLERITRDDEVSKVFADLGEKYREKTVFGKFAGYAYARVIPLLMRDHKDDLFEILAILTGKTVETIHKQNGFITVLEMKKWITDDVIRFFTSSADLAAEK